MENAYVVADDIEVGFKNKLPSGCWGLSTENFFLAGVVPFTAFVH